MKRFRLPALTAVAAPMLALSGCGADTADAPGGADEIPAETPDPAANEVMSADSDTEQSAELPVGTPLDQRVATLGLLNKRNNVTIDVTLKPGEEKRVEDVLIKLATCERRPPWDPEPETGAFVQVDVKTPDSDDDDPVFERVFSGWLFLNSPSLNVVEHPIYDVWVKHCAMTFPGEEAPTRSAS